MRPLHIVWVLANNSSAPYFSWFAERAQSESRVRFTFVALFHQTPEMLAEMEKLGSKAYWIPFDQHKRSSSMVKAFPKLVRLFRKLKPDAVHAHLFDDAVPSLAAARIAGVKMRVITKGDTGFHWFFAPKGIKFDRLNNRNATHILAISEECRAFILEKEEADPKKMRMIHHGIPDALTLQTEEAKARLRKRFDIKENQIVIGTVARLIEWKGYRHIIEAAAILKNDFPQLRFLFAGQGDQKTELETLVAKNGLQEMIQFTGWIDRADIPSFYGIMDIYLHAAAYEPFGFVIAEAMMNSTPVVSTPTGAAKDAIRDGVNGILAKEAAGPALAAAIRKMLSADRKSLGKAGAITAAEKFRFETMWKNHMKLYEETGIKILSQ